MSARRAVPTPDGSESGCGFGCSASRSGPAVLAASVGRLRAVSTQVTVLNAIVSPCRHGWMSPHPVELTMHSSKVAIASAVLSLWAASVGAATVTPADVMGQVGHNVRVCGLVASANYQPDTRAHPTFLTLIDPDRPSANQALTAVIFGDDRAKFGTPEMALQGQRICV